LLNWLFAIEWRMQLANRLTRSHLFPCRTWKTRLLLFFVWSALLISSVSAIGIRSALADAQSLHRDTLALIDKFRTTLSAPLSQRRLVEADIPAIGCPLDGQAGPQDTPTLPKTIRTVIPEGTPSSLAYYSDFEGAGTGVLAPKGWDCFGTYGSGGSSLYVTPRKLADPIPNRPEKVKDGPVVIKNHFISATSGRFPVAQISARIFPLARIFVEGVRDTGLDDASNYVFAPWATDRLNYLSDFAVSYVTPSGANGVGTAFGPAPGKEPISGLVFLTVIGNEEGPNLERLAVRLHGTDQRLHAAIAVSRIASLDLYQPDGAWLPEGLNANELTQKLYDWCHEKWGIPETIATCLLEDEHKYGAALSKYYQKALKLAQDNAQTLRGSQRRWLKYQEENCKFHELQTAQEGSGIARAASARCLLLTTLQRLQELRQITEQP
jgi:uncharacterized protein YecT (DUF1311 family)